MAVGCMIEVSYINIVLLSSTASRGNTFLMFHFPRNRISHLMPSENILLLVLAIIVGLATGLAVQLFRSGIELVHEIFVVGLSEGFVGETLHAIGMDERFAIVPILALVGFVVGWIGHIAIGEEKYHGVASIMASVALTGGRLPYMRIPAKMLASMLSLGGGASVGAEDPSVQIGANVGSFFGQRLHMSEERVKLLVSAGAASAIAAAFHAPIAGVFFALEIILGEFSTRSFGTVVLAAVISSAYTQGITEGQVLFDGVAVEFTQPLQLPLYAILGALLALFSALAVPAFYRIEHGWQRLGGDNLPLRATLTGALIGIMGVFLPQIMGAGEGFMHDVLSGEANLGIGLLILLGFAKLVATALSLGGGFMGGVFAPTLFIGIVFGQAYGQILRTFLPIGVSGMPPAYAIAGMAGLMAGIVRAPITAVMLVFEVTDDYALILPIMLTAVTCTILIEIMGKTGIYHLSLLKNGIHLEQGRDVDVMQKIPVREAMLTPAPTIHQDANLMTLRDAFHDHHTRALCVVDDDYLLVGIVTLGDLQRAYETSIERQQDPTELRVSNICTRDVVTTSPDEALWTAIHLMGGRDIGRMPVVKTATRQVLGMLRRQDIMHTYNLAITRKMHANISAEQLRLNTLTGAHVVEYYLHRDHPYDKKCICDIDWPPEAVVASIRRGSRLIVPHGNTELKAGDFLTIVADEQSEMLLNHMFEQRIAPTDNITSEGMPA
jgi:CIC family chloride channel protein